MALSGIQIYKLLPQTNCKECGFPTCLAFAMKLAAKQVELSSCPYVSEASKAQLEESAAPPIRLITLKSDGHEVKVGNEVVLYRHEKTFYNKSGIFVKLPTSKGENELVEQTKKIDQYRVNYVGMDLEVDGIAIEDNAGDATKMKSAINAVRSASKKPLILISSDENVLDAGLSQLNGETPMICCATQSNWEKFADLAGKQKSVLAITSDKIEELAELTEKVKSKGVEDIVLVPNGKNLGHNLILQTQIRRAAIKANFRALGYPTLAFC